MTKTTYRNAKKEKFTPISNSLLWDKEASLQAKGLLSIFLSNSNDWELNMKEIITRSKNGRDAHYKVVNELIELGYFARVQVVDPVKRQFEEMIYIFSDIKQEVADEIENVKQWVAANGKDLIIEYKVKKEKKVKKETFSDFQETEEKPIPENQYAEDKKAEKQYINNTKRNNTNLNNINFIDDDKRSSQQVRKNSSIQDDKSINLIISNLRESTEEELTDRSFNSVVRKVMDKHSQGKVSSFRDYLVTALIKKIEELELRRAKDQAKEGLKMNSQAWIQEKKQKLEQQPLKQLPFYDWLNE